ncbi:hypothetical protein GQ600_13265 [Phytophthora cactorum]|nr:hypothetical protein GQ600_13265 [Phytophthora cactorum]
MLWTSKRVNKKAQWSSEVAYRKLWMQHESAMKILTMYEVEAGSGGKSGFVVDYSPVYSQVGYVICCESPTTLPDFVFQFQEDDTTFYYKVRNVRPSARLEILTVALCRMLVAAIWTSRLEISMVQHNTLNALNASASGRANDGVAGVREQYPW